MVGVLKVSIAVTFCFSNKILRGLAKSVLPTSDQNVAHPVKGRNAIKPIIFEQEIEPVLSKLQESVW